MRSRIHLLCIFLCVVASPLAAAEQRESRPPNIVLIFTDDQGYRDLGCCGSPNIKTPHLDNMASEGLRLTSFYAQPVCGVSRAALMTGCYPIRIAEPDNIKRLHTVPHPKEVTMAEVLRRAGYATGIIGKWHLGLERPGAPGGVDPETMPNAQGFDYFYGTPNFNGHTVKVDDTTMRVPMMRNGDVVVEAVESWDNITADYTREAIDYITRNKDKPFFLYLAHNMPHIPLGDIDRTGNGARFFDEGPRKLQVPLTARRPAHGFIAFGNSTYILDADGKKTWTYPQSTRDGYVLKDASIVLTLSKSQKYPGGAVVQIDSRGDETLIWKGTQSEVNSAHPTDTGTIVITEAGDQPRLLEIDRTGISLIEFPLVCQTQNHHLQTRMARKLDDGTYLVPHLLDFAVLQYDARGNVLSKLDTTVPGDTNHDIHSWPFTAIRHGDGETLVCCTNGNRVVNFDSDGKVNWQLTNDDLPGPWLQDPCGGQVLPNGNFVIACYAAGRKDASTPKLFEITRDKKVVWKHIDGENVGIHHFQILDSNGKALADRPMK